MSVPVLLKRRVNGVLLPTGSAGGTRRLSRDVRPLPGRGLQHSIEGKAPGQDGRQGTRPNDGTALMTVTPDLDLWPMFAGTPDQVPDRIKAQGTVGRLASLKSSSALGASWLRAGLLHNRQIWAADDGLDM